MEGLTKAQACWSAGPLGTHVHLGKAGLKVCLCSWRAYKTLLLQT